MAITNFSSFMQLLLFHYFFVLCFAPPGFFSLFIFLYSHYAHKLCEIYLLSALKKHTVQDIYTEIFYTLLFVSFSPRISYFSFVFWGTNLVDCKNFSCLKFFSLSSAYPQGEQNKIMEIYAIFF